MSESFSFPPDPELDEIFVLPDGNSVQWNGYAWVPVPVSDVTYPITIAKGGTSATTVAAAQTNLVIGLTSIDDTAPPTPKYGDRWVKPSNMTEMVWVPNATNDGIWINPSESSGGGGGGVTYPITIDKGGTNATDALTANRNLGIPIFTVNDVEPTTPFFGDRWIRPNSMSEVVWMPNANNDGVWVNLSGGGSSGGDTGIPDAPSDGIQYGRQDAAWTPISTDIRFPDGTVNLPGIAWEQDITFGWKREVDGVMSLVNRGEIGQLIDSSLGRFEIMNAYGLGSNILLHKGPWSNADDNMLEIKQDLDGYGIIRTTVRGAAVRGNLKLDAPAILSTGSITAANQISVNTSADANWAVLTLNSSPTSGTAIEGKHSSSQRWGITMPDSTPETGLNSGSNFGITRYDDTGAWLGQSFAIDRATGNVTAQGLTTTAETAILQSVLDSTNIRVDQHQFEIDDIKSQVDPLDIRISELTASLLDALLRIQALENK
jgi:hypothetical protein